MVVVVWDYINCITPQDQVRKAQKKIAEENVQKAVKTATEMAQLAASDGKTFCISHVDVGLDTTAVREAVLKVIEQKVVSRFLPFRWSNLMLQLLQNVSIVIFA